MNFEKYSKERFESLGLNTPAARKLADELQVDVNDEIHEAMLPAFQKSRPTPKRARTRTYSL